MTTAMLMFVETGWAEPEFEQFVSGLCRLFGWSLANSRCHFRIMQGLVLFLLRLWMLWCLLARMGFGGSSK